MEPLIRAIDPGSDRLSREQVIEIHKAHRRGMPWKQIAEDYGTTWKNVSRIVQGIRWRSIHPAAAPELYVDTTKSPKPWERSPVADILGALDEMERQIAVIRSEVSQLPS